MAGTAALTPLFDSLGSYPPVWADAWTFMGSLLATYGMARGWTEFWLIWVAVDIVGVPLLFSAGYYASAVMYLFYGFFTLTGFFVWWRASKQADQAGHGRNRLPGPAGGQMSAADSAAECRLERPDSAPPRSAAMDAALEAARQGPRGANPLVGAVVIDRRRNASSSPATTAAPARPTRKPTRSPRRPPPACDLSGTTMRGHAGALQPLRTHRPVRPGDHRRRHHATSSTPSTTRTTPPPAARRPCAPRGSASAPGSAPSRRLDLNRRWFDAVAAKRPFVTLHIAQTLDSRIAASDGTSQWISSPESLADNHALRGRIDAILVGTQTVLVDNPRLTARDADGEPAGQQPLRAVMGYRGIPDGRRHQRRRRQGPAPAHPRPARGAGRAVRGRSPAPHGGRRLPDPQRLPRRRPRGRTHRLPGPDAARLRHAGPGGPRHHHPGRRPALGMGPASGGAVQMLGRDLRLHLRPGHRPPAPKPGPTTSSDSTPRRTGADTAAGGN